MSNELISQQELQDHKALMEKIRVLCDRLDELFLIYDQLQLAVPEHNADSDAHRDIRELIIALDEKESDHYSELNNTINNNNSTVNSRIDNLTAAYENYSHISSEQIDSLKNTTSAILSGEVIYANPLVSEVKTRTFLNGNTGVAALNCVSPAGYNTLLRVKSTNGVFTESAYNNKYQVSYTSDTTIASTTNAVDKTNVLIDENGNASFCNNVTVANTITAAEISGHVAKADRATTSDTTAIADKAKCLTSVSTFSPDDTYSLQYTCGKFNGFAGSSNNVSLLSYPNNGTSVTSNGIADIQNIRLLWSGNSPYWHDLFMSPNHTYIWHRNVRGNTANPWARIVEESNSTVWDINISGSAGSAVSAAEATHSVSADRALHADTATTANNAVLAEDAKHAVNADNAVNATNAVYANTSGRATLADSATNAVNATSATNDSLNNPIHTQYVNAHTAQTINGDKTFNNTVTLKGPATVNNASPIIGFSSSSLTSGSRPSNTVTEGTEYKDKNGNVLASIKYTADATGSSMIHIACTNSARTSSASVDLGFDTLTDTTSSFKLNVDSVEPGRANTTIGTTNNKFANVYTSGVTLDNDGIGTIKLLARVYTNNTINVAYSNVSGSNLFPVSFVTGTETVSGSIAEAQITAVIDKSSPQSGTWQPLNYITGSWRGAGGSVIGMYRRIL
jgi:hypothetical protein